MIRMAASSGTTHIVATPHSNDWFSYDRGLIDERIQDLSRQVNGISILRGCDFHLSLENIQAALANPSHFTIAGGSYLLVEFPESPVGPSIHAALELLRQEDVRMIVTHPERNPYLRDETSLLRSWVDAGSLLQITGCSLTGRFGKQAGAAAWKLLESGLAQLVASDAHDTVDRHPRLDETYATIRERLGNKTADLVMVENPQAVIESKTTEQTRRPAKRWFHFFK